MAIVDVEIDDAALNASWVRREVTGNHDWCKVFMHEISQAQFIWERNSSSLRKMAWRTYNKFWSEVMVAMAQYNNSVKTEIEKIGKHCIWYSNHTEFYNIELRSWKQRGMVYINDLLKENGEILSFEGAKSMYDFSGTILDYLGLVQILPFEWRNRQRKVKQTLSYIRAFLEFWVTNKVTNIFAITCYITSIRTLETIGNRNGSWN